MNILLMVQDEQRIILEELYEAIVKYSDTCTVLRLSSREQANLKKYFKENVQTENYDRIILILRFKKEIRQASFQRTIPNLVFLEHDAWQNYAESKYRGVFSKHYSKMPWARIICSGYTLQKKLEAEGFDAVCVPKGYAEFLSNTGSERDIEMAFVGSLKSKSYSKRKDFLEELKDSYGIQILKTESGEEYKQTLNRIRFFISADIEFGENMVKNFEAMACGCVLCVYDQGEYENKCLGFEDMKNVILYKTKEELIRKLEPLRKDLNLALSIAAKGQNLAESRFTWDEIGRQIIEALKPPLRKKKVKKTFGFKKYTWEN